MLVPEKLTTAPEHLNTFLDTTREARHLPSLAAAVVHDRDLLWARGFGYADVERQMPATPHTMYRLASVTEVVTATMLMHLRDAGIVHLDDPLTRYVPTFRMRSIYPDTMPITLRHLATHLAGLPKDFPYPTLTPLRSRPSIGSSPSSRLPRWRFPRK